MSVLMERLRTKLEKPLPPSIVMYGRPGVGKSEFASWAPKPAYAYDATERGVETLYQAGKTNPDMQMFDPIEDWDQLMEITSLLGSEQHDRKTFIVDTAGGIAQLCIKHVTRTYFQNDPEKFDSYGAGFKRLVPVFQDWITLLEKVRNNGVMPIVLAHCDISQHKDPTGSDYMKYDMSLDKRLKESLSKWADMVLFANVTYNISVNKQDEKAGKAGKQTGDHLRVIHTTIGAGYEAKCRYSLPGMISMGGSGKEAFANFWSHLRPFLVKKEEVNA